MADNYSPALCARLFLKRNDLSSLKGGSFWKKTKSAKPTGAVKTTLAAYGCKGNASSRRGCKKGENQRRKLQYARRRRKRIARAQRTESFKIMMAR